MADLFSDGFESGDLSAWDANENDGGDLSAETAAALHGNYGLNLFIDDQTALLVSDTVVDETRYRCRFYIDPNTLTMSDFHAFDLIKAWDGVSSIFYVILEYRNGIGYRIKVGIKDDATSITLSASQTVTDAPHCVEFDWMAATGVGQNDGYISLWIDGVFKETVGSIDNDTRELDMVQFGACAGLDVDTAGTFFLDDFASNNDGSVIGQISENAIFFGCNF